MATYIGKRIVPVHCGKWDMSKAYEMLSIVLEDMGGGGAYAAPLAHDIFAYLVEHLQNTGELL